VLNKSRAVKLGEADAVDKTKNAVVKTVDKRIAMLMPRKQTKQEYCRCEAEG
jgi:hypothetical protein